VLSVAAAPWVLFLGFPMIRTFGQGLMPLSARVVIPNWFSRNRARAFSILGLALTLSVAVVPPLTSWLIDWLGWRMAWRVSAVGLVILVVPVVMRFLRDRPEDIGQLPDGALVQAGVAPRTDAGIGLSLAEARRTPAFWGFVIAGLVPPLVTTGLHLHQVAIFADRGTPHAIAAATFTIEAGAMLGANIVVGWLNHRVSPRLLLVVGLVLMAATLLALLLSGHALIAMLYGALRGASNGVSGVAIDVAWPTYYGRRHLGSIRGFGMAASLFGSAIGPLPFGFAVSLFGGYTPAILGLMVLPAVVAVWIMVMPLPTLRPRPEVVTVPPIGD
ncbi:MAG: MFS transporter, partial [Thermomicrobiales bacterium]